jgi:uncharacterized repeat protein (TIGR04138 family)
MTMFDDTIADLLSRDERYALEAYEFIFHALHHTQKLLDRVPPEGLRREGGEISSEYHVSGAELVQGARDLAVQEFGLMARVVFKMWGINATADFGEIVFNLIDAGLMTRTDRDRREDFHDVYDLDRDLLKDFRIPLEEAHT